MLDHFVFGSVTRISPEAPVPVVEHRRDEYRLGGAANVASNVQALGAQVRIVGIVGEDEAGARVVAALGIAGADASGLRRDSGRLTTRKLRIVTTRNQQVARVDYEADEPLTAETEQALLAAAVERVDGSTAVVLSDYLKGAVTPAIARGVIEAARRRNIPVLVDPKVPHVDAYGGATFITPNDHEAEAVTLRIRTWDGARRRGPSAIELAARRHTRGEHGMAARLAPADRRGAGVICRGRARVSDVRRRRHCRGDVRGGARRGRHGARRGPHRESRRGHRGRQVLTGGRGAGRAARVALTSGVEDRPALQS
jgi:D-beta-D-heptose 7-phosphate kinase/D-beta-D-heptose 1-phosphate adenosyltransferase